MTAGLEHDPGAIRERAAELLSRPPYREDEGLLDQLWGTLRDWLAEGVSRVLALLSGDTTMGWAVVVMGLVVLGVVGWRATRGLALDRAVEEAPLGDGGGRSSAEWAARADEAARRGHYDEAVRARYLALVTGLAEQGTIEEVPGRTVGELERELEVAAPTLAAPVARAGAIFAEVFYGRQPATAAEADRVTELAARVRPPARSTVRVGVGRPAAGEGP
jgi:hypothetical protein